MSDTWVPKVGDRVMMVGEHGPYFVAEPVMAGGGWDLRTHTRWVAKNVPADWLSPAPEEPTAPGALVRSSQGILLFRSTGDASRWYEVMTPGGGYWEWDEIPRPVTVVLADPVEVEQLRAEVDGLRDELSRQDGVLQETYEERDAYRKAKQENDERFQLEAARQRERADQLQNELDYIYRRLSEGPAVRTYESEVRWREWVAASISRRGKS